MKAIKPSIALSVWSQQVLACYGTQNSTGPGLATVVNAMIERYNWLAEQVPTLSDDDWELLLNVYAGSEMASVNPPFRVGSDIMDHFGWSVDEVVASDHRAAVLARKCSSMSQAEQLAILDRCQRFWTNPSTPKPGQSLVELLSQLNTKAGG